MDAALGFLPGSWGAFFSVVVSMLMKNRFARVVPQRKNAGQAVDTLEEMSDLETPTVRY